jgi:multimeric flavodoxin WrbA
MDGLNPKMLEADAIVLVSPVYYWGLSSQLKAVIDRWQPTVFAMQGHNKKGHTIDYTGK